MVAGLRSGRLGGRRPRPRGAVRRRAAAAAGRGCADVRRRRAEPWVPGLRARGIGAGAVAGSRRASASFRPAAASRLGRSQPSPRRRGARRASAPVARVRCAAPSVRSIAADDRSADVTRGRHRLRDELDPAAGRRRHRGRDGALDLRDVHREMRIVRLGQGVDATGELAPEALERTRAALVDYAAVLRRKGAERVRMVATSATRDAGNREEFFGMVRDTLGVDAEVITGDEEAQLVVHRRGRRPRPRGRPVPGHRRRRRVDRAGGRHARGRRRAVSDAACSVDIGSVRITERCLAGDPPTADEVARAREVATAHPGRRVRRRARWRACAPGSAWPARSPRCPRWPCACPSTTRPPCTCPGSPREDLHRVAERAARHEPRPSADRTARIHPGRIDVIGGGALIVDVLAARAGRARRRRRAGGQRARHPRRHRPLHRLTPAPWKGRGRLPRARVHRWNTRRVDEAARGAGVEVRGQASAATGRNG